MGTFLSNGSTGPAPTTTFLGSVPDRLTMGLPYYPHAGGGFVVDTQVAANYVNKWIPFNPVNTHGLYGNPGPNENTVSLGGFITAPDGTTSTMQKIIESATNTEHYLTCGYLTEMTGGYLMRVAVIAKAAERTRIGLSIMTTQLGQDGVSVGVKTIFDLAGGQIGVAPYVFGSDTTTPLTLPTWTTAASTAVATILPLGGGVYVCQMDVKVGILWPGDIGMLAGFYLDNGSGTGAASLSYSGNGTSGVYAWKSSILPTRAWQLNSRAFFDDFTDPTMANIDLNDTRAPGFDWYVHGTWQNDGFAGLTPIPSGNFHQSGSVLTIGPNIPASSIFFGTAASVGAGAGNIGGTVYNRALPGPNAANSYVGTRLFKPPMLVETSFAWRPDLNANGNNDASVWTTPLERLYNPGGPFASNGYVFGGENDWFEQRPGGGEPSHSCWDTTFQTYIAGNFWGIPVWYSTFTYNTVGTVYYLGQIYRSQVNGNLNNPPATSPTQWATYITNTEFGPTTQPQIDQTQQNTYHCIWLPDPGDGSDLGQQVNFFNSIFITRADGNNSSYGHMTYGLHAKDLDSLYLPSAPRVAGNTTFGAIDNATSPVWVQLPGSPEITATMSFDWVSVITE